MRAREQLTSARGNERRGGVLPPDLGRWVRRSATSALAPLRQHAAGLPHTGTTVTLYRVIGRHEYAMLEDLGWSRLPSRKEWSTVVVRLMERRDAEQVVERRGGSDPNGPLRIIALRVDRSYAELIRVDVAGAIEYWTEAQHLDLLNEHIVGPIRLVS